MNNKLCCQNHTPPKPNTAKDYFEISLAALFLGLAYVLVQKLNILPDLGVSSDMSYLMVFGLGLVAAFSTCIATTGSLLVAVSSRYAEKSFTPHIYFNLGRLSSYAVFGAAIGGLGSIVTLSPFANGILVVAVSGLMIFLGLKMLRLLPNFGFSLIPASFSEKIYEFGKKKSGAFISGAATFFLPCGFTQALQVYVLGRGDIWTGAFTMFVFALGTAPSLLSLGAVSSLGGGLFRNYFLKLAGIAVVVFGIANIGNGLNLAGFGVGGASAGAVLANPFADEAVSVEGKQVVNMKIVGLDYEPSQFTVRAGRPVEWLIDGSAAVGCARAIVVPQLGLSETIIKGKIKKITYIPRKPGRITFSCSMGMTTPGAAFNVVQ